MACKFLYQGQEFETENDILAFIAQQLAETAPAVEEELLLQSTEENTLPSAASPAVLAKVKEFLKRIGVTIQGVKIVNQDGVEYDANGLANLVQNVIQIVEGKEDVALTEEASHFAVEIIEQTNPKLYNDLLNKIGSYDIYKAVLASPVYRAAYKLPNGNPDIRAMKKEAIGKVLAETFIKQGEETEESPENLAKAKSWWKQIIEFLKGLFQKADFNPFEEAAKVFTQEDVAPINYKGLAEEVAEKLQTKNMFAISFKAGVEAGEYADSLKMFSDQLQDEFSYNEALNSIGGDEDLANRIRAVFNPMLQATDSIAQNTYNKLLETHKKIVLSSPNGGDSFYEIDGKRIKNRVTDKAKAYYEKTFKSGEMTKGETQTAIDDFKKDKGTAGHADMEALFHKYIDDEGNRRETPLATPMSQMDPNNAAIINKLDKYMQELLDTYPAGTKFLAEVRVYDAAKDEAGTMDFVAILKDGTVDIRDWKFMDIAKGSKDVAWYKKKAFNIQIGEYKEILKKNYGVKAFRYTRAIPIKTKYEWANYTTKDKLVLKGIGIGDVDPSKIEDLTLLPVGTEDESTGNTSVDAYIKQLNALYQRLSKEKVEEGRRDIKRDKLNNLDRAIRTLQIKGSTKELLTAATAIISSVERDITNYRQQLENGGTLSRQEIRALAQKLIEDHDIIELFTDIDRKFRTFELAEGQKEALKEIGDKAKGIIEDISEQGGLRETVGDIIANGYGIKNLLSPEKVVGMLVRNFRSLSQAATASTKVLWKMVEKMASQREIEYDQEITKLEKMKADVEELAKSKGTTANELLKKLLSNQKDGKWGGRLVYKTSRDFYEGLKKAQKDGDVKWIKNSIDNEAYATWYKERLAGQTEYENNTTYNLSDEQANQAERKRRIEDFKKKYDPKLPSAYNPGNDILRRFPAEGKWVSEEYKEIESMPALLTFYNYWQERMKESYKLGMIQGAGYNRFVPNVHKSLIEKVMEGTRKGNLTDSFLNSIRNTEEEVVIDTLTGKPVEHIAPAYINDLGERVAGQEGLDYSQKSDDLFKIMALWTDEMVKFKLRTEIESEARLLQSIERNKSAIVVNKRTGEVGEINNDSNAQYFDNFMNNILYGRRYTDKGDLTTKINVNDRIRKINAATKKYLGIEVLPLASKDEMEISGTRTVEALNRWFQMKTLGFNIPSALTNLLGGKTNAYINSGKDITRGDLFASESLIASGKGDSIFAGLVSYFLPLTDSEMREKSRMLSVKGTAANMSGDWLFYLQRKSERFVQLPIFGAFARNTMVENGELVNIRRHVKAKNNEGTKYQLPLLERTALEDKTNKEIEELKNTRSLFKIATIVNDELVIPGIERNSETVYKFRNMVQQFSKDALGNMDPNDIAQYRMNLLGKSVMMFKNWIPRMLDVRFGGLRYEVGKDDWEWGRYNMALKGLLGNLADATKDFIGLASGKESLIEKAQALYIIKRAEFGEEDFMTEAQFVDMYVRGAQQIIKEIAATLSLVGIFYSVAAAAPDDDDEITKGAHKWALRLADKGIDELSFFYNPLSLTAIANGSVFPALGVVTDIQRFAINAGKDAFYSITGNEEGADKTKTSKYLFKAAPITKEMVTYMGLFSHEFAKEFGVHVSTESRAGR